MNCTGGRLLSEGGRLVSAPNAPLSRDQGGSVARAQGKCHDFVHGIEAGGDPDRGGREQGGGTRQGEKGGSEAHRCVSGNGSTCKRCAAFARGVRWLDRAEGGEGTRSPHAL